MPPGGTRVGRPGQTYPNRTDLQGGDRQYGDAVNKAAVARTPDAPTSPVPPPGSFGPLTAPSRRPDEPVTAGLPLGAGPGPDVLGPIAPTDDALWELRALAARFPSRDMMRLIAMAESEL